MNSFSTELGQILRRLWRTPAFTVVTLFTLTAGIGANTAVFSVVEGVLLKPLPYPHPESLVGVWHTAPGLNLDEVNMAPLNYFIYREQNRVFEDIGMYEGNSVSVTGRGNPEQMQALDVTEGVLPTLGLKPLLGRWFHREDTSPHGPDTVMLSYDFWQSHLGGDSSAVGKTIRVDGKSRQIIGVMPREFRFLDWEPPALFLPLVLDRNKTTLGQFSYEGVARLRPGVTMRAANEDVGRMWPIVLRSFPAPPGFNIDLFTKSRLAPKVRPLSRDVIGDVGKLLWILMGSIGVVLLIACANVANLLLVRAEARHQELSIRTALGASPWQVAKGFLLESALLGLLGSVLGLVLAWGALRLLVALAPAGLPRLHDISIDGSVLIFTLGITLFSSLLFGSVPALRFARARVTSGLGGSRTASAGRERHRTRNTLVIIQVSLAFVLLICSGLMIRTFRALVHVDAGYDTAATMQTVQLGIPEAEVPKDEEALRKQQAILEKIAAIPGVQSASFGNAIPMDDNGWRDQVAAQDHADDGNAATRLRRFTFGAPGFLKTLGIPLVAGRDFTWNEIFAKVPVVMVSENFAREYWGSAPHALGKRIRVTTKDDWREIVGVIGNVHWEGIDKDAPSVVYWPTFLSHFESSDTNLRRFIKFVIRTPRAGSEGLMKDLRQAVWSVDANLPLTEMRTQDYYYRKSIARTSFTLVMLGIASAIALLLGIVGLYGVIAYSASQRTREIGIRIALGAQRSTITSMFVRQGLVLTAGGIACGLVLAFAASRLLQSLLFHVSPADPVTYAVASLGLCAAAWLASYIPSRRTATVNPVDALRAE
ncbi:MAG: putative transport system permease protein [Acidobacteriaceae bacterium]|nr:putative transport system permease protein [Acidobacteriaceae bacterium]